MNNEPVNADNFNLIVQFTKVYAAVAIVTLGLLAVFSYITPNLVTKDAWVHSIIVSVFAIVLPLRARSAQQGTHSALRATGIIASVLLVINVVEGILPNFMPTWIRVIMFVIAILMLLIIGLVIKISVRRSH